MDTYHQVIDARGYRANVGIIVASNEGLLVWCKRSGQNAWQFPQGGIKGHESLEEALFRELEEETGLRADHVTVMGSTKRWLHYRLPNRLIQRKSSPRCIGQKQRWFLLKLDVDDSHINLGCSKQPEFDNWRWVNYWHPVDEVVFFKRKVYKEALRELEPLLHKLTS